MADIEAVRRWYSKAVAIIDEHIPVPERGTGEKCVGASKESSVRRGRVVLYVNPAPNSRVKPVSKRNKSRATCGARKCWLLGTNGHAARA